MFTNPIKQTWMKIFGVALLAISLPVFAQPQGPGGPAAGRPGAPDRPGAAFGPGGPGGPGRGLGQGFGRFGRFGGPGRAAGMAVERTDFRGPRAARGMRMAHWRHEGREGGHPSVEMLLRPGVREKLGLTDDQVKKIQDIAYNNQKEAIQLKAKLEQAELDMRRLLQDKRPDRNKVLAQVDAVAQAKTALVKQKINGLLDARDVLTDQQVDQIHKFIQERGCKPGMERLRERFREHGGPGFGGMRGQGGPGGPGFGGRRGPRGQGGPNAPAAPNAPKPPQS